MFVGDVFGGEVYELTFSAAVTNDALDRDIANVARVTGAPNPAPEGGGPGHWGSKDPYPVNPGDPDGGYTPEGSVELVSESTPPTYPTADGDPSSNPVPVQPADPDDSNNGPNGGNGLNGDGSNGNGGGAGGNALANTGTNGSGSGGGADTQVNLATTGDATADSIVALCLLALISCLTMFMARKALLRL